MRVRDASRQSQYVEIEARPNGSLVNGFLRWHQCGINDSLEMIIHTRLAIITNAMCVIVATLAIIAPAPFTRDPFGLA